MIQDTAPLNDAVRRLPCPAPDAADLARVRLVALNLACEAAAACAPDAPDAPEMQALAERAAAIESLLRQVRRDR